MQNQNIHSFRNNTDEDQAAKKEFTIRTIELEGNDEKEEKLGSQRSINSGGDYEKIESQPTIKTNELEGDNEKEDKDKQVTRTQTKPSN